MSYGFTAVVRGALCVILTGFAPVAIGQPFTIANALSANGTTLLRLQGPIANGCIVWDASVFAVTGNSISVTSAGHQRPDCFPVPPPGYVNLLVDVGPLPAGLYDVDWAFAWPTSPPIVEPAASAQIRVVIPIPAIGSLSLVACALALALTGCAALRRWRPV